MPTDDNSSIVSGSSVTPVTGHNQTNAGGGRVLASAALIGAGVLIEPELLGGALLGAGVVYALPIVGQVLRPVVTTAVQLGYPVMTTAVQLGYAAAASVGDLVAGARDQVQEIVANARSGYERSDSSTIIPGR
jgi:2-methylcitrate dehydratase PrpD